MKQKFRRKKLVQKSLQLKLTATLVSISSLATLLQIFLFNRALLSIAHELPESDALLLRELPQVLGTNIAWTLVVLVPIMFYAGINLTHRIAGPAYRMEQYLRGLARGEDASRPCRIRKNDELQTLCDALNDAVGVLTGATEPMRAEEEPSAETSRAAATHEPASLAESLEHREACKAHDEADQRSV